ncbi:hypothetical protein D3C77_454470 [compost metagenome]
MVVLGVIGGAHQPGEVVIKRQLQLATSGGLHPGEGSRQDYVVTQVNVVEHCGVTFKVAGVINGLELKRNFKIRHFCPSPTG